MTLPGLIFTAKTFVFFFLIILDYVFRFILSFSGRFQIVLLNQWNAECKREKILINKSSLTRWDWWDCRCWDVQQKNGNFHFKYIKCELLFAFHPSFLFNFVQVLFIEKRSSEYNFQGSFIPARFFAFAVFYGTKSSKLAPLTT